MLGAYGFGYGFANGRHVLSAQLGNVVLGADVEIGAGSTIDRGTYGPTSIGEGTKIDDSVMVAHNCRLGRHNMLCSQVGVAGSTTTGDYVVMAGQVGVRDHVHIGDRAVLGAMAGVTNDVPADARMIGIPATPERDQKIKQAAFSKLPEMRRQLKQLQRAVDALVSESAVAKSTTDSPDDENGHRAVSVMRGLQLGIGGMFHACVGMVSAASRKSRTAVCHCFVEAVSGVTGWNQKPAICIFQFAIGNFRSPLF